MEGLRKLGDSDTEDRKSSQDMLWREILYCNYLPIQKLEKIFPNKSSEVNSPVISHND